MRADEIKRKVQLYEITLDVEKSEKFPNKHYLDLFNDSLPATLNVRFGSKYKLQVLPIIVEQNMSTLRWQAHLYIERSEPLDPIDEAKIMNFVSDYLHYEFGHVAQEPVINAVNIKKIQL